MNKVSLKLFVQGGAAIDLAAIDALFHRVIQENLLPRENFVGVANYRHVVRGPWVQLVCTEGRYVFDGKDDKPGLKYVSRVHDDLALALEKATAMADLIERELGLRFRTDGVEVQLFDRKTYERVAGALQQPPP